MLVGGFGFIIFMAKFALSPSVTVTDPEFVLVPTVTGTLIIL